VSDDEAAVYVIVACLLGAVLIALFAWAFR
jgi:hypothetical protein